MCSKYTSCHEEEEEEGQTGKTACTTRILLHFGGHRGAVRLGGAVGRVPGVAITAPLHASSGHRGLEHLFAVEHHNDHSDVVNDAVLFVDPPVPGLPRELLRELEEKRLASVIKNIADGAVLMLNGSQFADVM